MKNVVHLPKMKLIYFFLLSNNINGDFSMRAIREFGLKNQQKY